MNLINDQQLTVLIHGTLLSGRVRCVAPLLPRLLVPHGDWVEQKQGSSAQHRDAAEGKRGGPRTGEVSERTCVQRQCNTVDHFY